MSAFRTFVDVVRQHVDRHPGRSALIYLDDAGGEAAHWTYAELDRRARGVAARLQAEAEPGARALLLFPPGIEFAAALMGCLYAGVVAVPLYPPRRNRTLARLLAVVRDAGAGLALTTAALRGRIETQAASELGWPAFRWLASDEPGPDAASWRDPGGGPQQPAFLQYTSGSTGDPKGVLVRHVNLLANNAAIAERFGHGPQTVMCGWLPLFHDMGLVGTLLHPLYLGVHSVLMSPAAFLQQPVRWLAAITRYRATSSGAPDSAYELCVERVADEHLPQLDLSSWQVAFNGAEPVRAATAERFQARFGACGLPRTALYPCYGMAEATLFVTGDRHDAEHRRHEVDREALEQHRVAEPARPGTGATLVSCGRPASGHRVLIVDPETRRACPEDRVGEIWFTGPSVAAGYWGREKLSAQVFAGRLADGGEDTFLRTGDLGFLHDGELYVTGRVKDLVIVAGRNHYPQDIEATVAAAHPALRAGSVAAFALDTPRGEALALAAEVRRDALAGLRADEVVQAVREALADEHEIELQGLLLLRPATLPKTSSGKLQRHLCRRGFLDGEALTTVHAWRHPGLVLDGEAAERATAAPVPSTPAARPDAVPSRTAAEIGDWLAARVGRVAGIDPRHVDRRAPFVRYGLDSRQAVALSGELGEWLGRTVAPTLAYDFPTIDAAARELGPASPASRGAAAASTPPGEGTVAVIGLACRFPGAPNAEAFWRLLRDGVDAVCEVPPGRWPTLPAEPHARRGGFLHEVDGFDAEFFGISPREAELMDPQQRLLLEIAWEALEHARLVPAHLAGSRTGVFVGISSQDYLRVLAAAGADTQAHAATGGALSIAANRISYALDLRGPSWAVDTACSSSLVAVHQACRSLAAGECDLALCGGVNLMLTPELSQVFTRAGMLSPGARCRTFDAEADGYVRGEGAGLVVLRRAADARRRGEHVLALVRGSAVNQDGLSNGLTAPNGRAQQETVRAALAQAGLAAADISYVEAHGTGTPLGDPIELNALGELLREGRGDDEPCWVGSVKTNIGHLEAAAGIAGLIKVVLALGHGEIPPHLHLRRPNPRIAADAAALRIPAQPTRWPRVRGARRAGVSSFGFGGTNAHVVLEEAHEPPAAPEARAHGGPALLLLSARTPAALQALARAHVDRLAETSRLGLPALAAAAAATRTAFARRAAIVAGTPDELRAALTEIGAGHAAGGEAGAEPRVGFLFTGQGALVHGAGRELYEHEPRFRAAFEECGARLRSHLEVPLGDVLYGGQGALLERARYAQPALLAFEYALASVWQAWGVEPAGLLGHSLGEYAAAVLAGAFPLEAALEALEVRGRLMDALPRGGAMLAVHGDVERTAEAAREFGPALAVAAHNGPRQAVLSGEAGAVAAAAQRLEAQGARTQPLATTHAFHSPLVEPMLPEFERALAGVRFAAPARPVISNLGGARAGDELASAAYWARHTRETVRFKDGVEALLGLGCNLLIEIGPRPLLLPLARRCAPDSTATWLASLDPPRCDRAALLANLGRAWTAGARLEWPEDVARAPHVDLPRYPFQHRRYWPKPKDAPHAEPGSAHPLLGRPLAATADQPRTRRFEAHLDLARLPGLVRHRIGGAEVLPYAAYLELALAAAEAQGAGTRAVEGLELHQPVFFAPGAPPTLQTVIDPQGDGSLGLRVFSRTQDGAWQLAASARLTLASEAAA